MFQPETEDMLPRMAPKPSAAVPIGGAEQMVRPQVPEVSILFGAGQQGANLQTLQQNMQHTQQTTSYAAWKKQMLPKVTFPAGLAAHEQMSHPELIGATNNNAGPGYNLPRSNLYPMRAAAIPAVSMALAANVNSNVYMAPNSNELGYDGGSANVILNPSCYRRSLDSCNSNINYQSQETYRKPVHSTPPSARSPNTPRDVLTICAGTQTDGVGSPLDGLQNGQPSSVASKQDVNEIKQIVQEIRHDQLRIMQMLESFVFSQHARNSRSASKDAAVQVDCDGAASPPILNGCCTDLGHTPAAAPTNKFIDHLKPPPNNLQSPKGKPMAQSTTYRPNSPLSNRLQVRQQIASPPPAQPAPLSYEQMAATSHKSATDKSLVMNELALKYLPNEKLAQLLNELNIAQPLDAPAAEKQVNDPSCNPPSTPLRNVGNFERNATDISNASYKYLKKYRLLPEDHEDVENDNPAAYNAAATPPAQPYDTLRNSPGQHRQQPNVFPQNANSPYQQQLVGRLPPSPLVRPLPAPQYRDNMLNLENIKQQPKFL